MQNQKALLGILFVTDYLVVVVVQPPQGLKPCSSVIRLKKEAVTVLHLDLQVAWSHEGTVAFIF